MIGMDLVVIDSDTHAQGLKRVRKTDHTGQLFQSILDTCSDDSGRLLRSILDSFHSVS